MTAAQRSQLAGLLPVTSRQATPILAMPPVAYTTHSLTRMLGIAERAARGATEDA